MVDPAGRLVWGVVIGVVLAAIALLVAASWAGGVVLGWVLN